MLQLKIHQTPISDAKRPSLRCKHTQPFFFLNRFNGTCPLPELMDVTDGAAAIGPPKAHRQENQRVLYLWAGKSKWGKVHCGEFKFPGRSTECIKQTALFDKDQRELLGAQSVFTSP